jgi:hypothetical protein
MAAENAKRHAARQAGSIFEHFDIIPDSTPFRSANRCPSATPSRKIFPQPLSTFARNGEPWKFMLLDSRAVAVNALSTSSP